MDAGSVAPQVVQLSLRGRVLVPIRAGLSALGLLAALALGAAVDSALLGWTFGSFLVSVILASGPRGGRDSAPEQLPGDAVPESWGQIARTDVFPSTVGLAVLTAAALTFDPVLAALLAGILGGMAVMTVVSWVQVVFAERRLGGLLFVHRGSRRLYVRDR